MLEIISYTISQYHPVDEFDELAESILDRLESENMLPPPNFGVYDSVPTVTPTGNHDYSYKREWTKE